jgi:hypothetical protein
MADLSEDRRARLKAYLCEAITSTLDRLRELPNVLRREERATRKVARKLQEMAEREASKGQPGQADATRPTAPDPPRAPTIWFHAERQYSIDRVTPLKVSEEFDSILQAFLESQAAMETSDIEINAGVTNASRAMQALAAWNQGIFKPAVRIPSGKAKGGYFIRVTRL